MKFTELGIVLLFFLLLGCTQPTTEANYVANNNSLNNTADQNAFTYFSSPLFMIYYPRGWHVTDNHESGVFLFTPPLENENDKMAGEFVVEFLDFGNKTTSADFEEHEKTLYNETATVTNIQNTTFKGKSAFVIEIEELGDPTMIYKTTYFKSGEWIYRLHYAIEKNKSNKYKPIMESILDKFVIGNG